jgi:hypothetical protein
MDGTGGWYPDPPDPARVRWWDGEWTEHVRDPQPASVATLAPAAPYASPESFDEPAAPPAALTLAPPPPPPPAPPAPPAPPGPAPIAPPPPLPSAALDLETVMPPRPVSSGAALLPPLPGATPPSSPQAPVAEQQPKKERKPRSPITVAIIVLGIGLALFAALWFGGIISPKSDTPVASNPDAVVYEGPGYTVEVPKDWPQSSADPAPNTDVTFAVPSGAAVTIGGAQGNAAALQGDAALQSVVDTVVRVQQAVYPDVQVVSQEPATLGGVPAQRVTLEGSAPDGTPVRVVELAALRDGRIVFLGVEGPPDVVAAATPAFDAAVASFAFTD